MKALTAQTTAELRTRINKGQSLLDPAHKILFAAWTNDYMDNCHRTVATFTKADLIKAWRYRILPLVACFIQKHYGSG